MVLTYELAGITPALFHDDGSMRKTTTFDLATKLEENCEDVLASLPGLPAALTSFSSAYIIDGMAMLQGLNENHFRTFTDLAVVVLKKVIRLLRNPSWMYHV